MPKISAITQTVRLGLVMVGLLIASNQTSLSQVASNRIYLSLTRNLSPSLFTIVVSNQSQNVVRIWRLENSWGYDALTVYLQDKDTKQEFSITRRPREWTVNAPTYHLIPARQRQLFAINLTDGWWQIPNEVDLMLKHYRIRIRLSIKETAESKQYHVSPMDVFSDWQSSPY